MPTPFTELFPLELVATLAVALFLAMLLHDQTGTEKFKWCVLDQQAFLVFN